MSTIAPSTPSIPQVNTFEGGPVVDQAPQNTPENLQTTVVQDEIGEIPGAPTSQPQTQTQAPHGQAASRLDNLTQHMTAAPEGPSSDRGDVDIAINEDATFDANSMPATLNATGNVITQNPELADSALTSINCALTQTQSASYNQTFQQGTYRPGSALPEGTTMADAILGSGSALRLNASAQRTLENLCSEGLPTDPMAFVQFVLRESYLETTNVLMDHANKVRFFNDVKKEIRARAQGIRDVLAQNAGAADTATIGNTPTEDINQSYYGATNTVTSTPGTATPTTETPASPELTPEQIEANAAYARDEDEKDTVTVKKHTCSSENDFQGVNDSDGIQTQYDNATSDTEEYVNDLSDEEWAALQESNTTVTVTIEATDEDGVYDDQITNTFEIQITEGMTKAEFLNELNRKGDQKVKATRDSFDQSDTFGVGDLGKTKTTIVFEKATGEKTPKYTAEELAAAHPNSPDAQAAAGYVPFNSGNSSPANSSSDVRLGQN
ncbi:MAG: hypothetical protein VX699_07185, partial [Myxococcota bacterium]|nr:hypothetical protein [Myxococcota bacterium]